ncbi:MAG: BMP family ABC transporter substrate-binding protein [Erysipelotrichaceae bacterium]|nr:BMP family ABC transporter substrate-binding protein [Erysipelotrichaceae bacterium]
MKKLLTLLLAVFMIFSLVGCSNGGGSSEPEAPAEETTDLTGKPLRILQFVSQTLGSLSCEDLVYDGIKKFCDETGSTVDTFEMNYDDTHAASQLAELCSSGKYDVVVTGYWSIEEYVEQAAQDFPDIKFLVFDCTIDFDTYPEIKKNVSSYLCQQNSLAFAAGALGALITESGLGLANEDKTIGFVGGGMITAIDDFLIGYIQGAHYVDPEVKVLYSYVGNWEDSGKAHDLAADQYNNGADVSFGVCAPASFGVCQAAYDAQRYAFGVDTDHSGQLQMSHPEQAEYTVSSAVKQFGYAIYDALKTIYDGTIVWGANNSFGFESGYLEMVETDVFNKTVKEGMPEVYAAYEEIVQKLLKGEIEVGTAVGATTEYVEAEKAKADPGAN